VIFVDTALAGPVDLKISVVTLSTLLGGLLKSAGPTRLVSKKFLSAPLQTGATPRK
jgi:hypothetical protein